MPSPKKSTAPRRNATELLLMLEEVRRASAAGDRKAIDQSLTASAAALYREYRGPYVVHLDRSLGLTDSRYLVLPSDIVGAARDVRSLAIARFNLRTAAELTRDLANASPELVAEGERRRNLSPIILGPRGARYAEAAHHRSTASGRAVTWRLPEDPEDRDSDWIGDQRFLKLQQAWEDVTGPRGSQFSMPRTKSYSAPIAERLDTELRRHRSAVQRYFERADARELRADPLARALVKTAEGFLAKREPKRSLDETLQLVSSVLGGSH